MSGAHKRRRGRRWCNGEKELPRGRGKKNPKKKRPPLYICICKSVSFADANKVCGALHLHRREENEVKMCAKKETKHKQRKRGTKGSNLSVLDDRTKQHTRSCLKEK
jgi:hypothetical protein